MKLTIKQIAERTGKDWTTVLGWIKRYGLKAEKQYSNFRWVVEEKDLEEFLDKHKTTS